MTGVEKVWPQKDKGIYPDGCIICQKSFSVGCTSSVKVGNDGMVGSICCELFPPNIFAILINSLMCACFHVKLIIF